MVLAGLAHDVAIFALEYLDRGPHLVKANRALKVLVEHGQVRPGGAQAATPASPAEDRRACHTYGAAGAGSWRGSSRCC